MIKKIFIATVLVIAATLSSCNDPENNPTHTSADQEKFLAFTAVSVVENGVNVLNFSYDNNQVSASGTTYKVIDNYGFTTSTITLSAVPTSGSKVSATIKTGAMTTVINDLSLVSTKAGLIYLWCDTTTKGVILPVQY